MWGKRKKRGARLPRQLALGLLEEAMGRVQQREEEEDEPSATRYPGAAPAPPRGSPPPDQAGLHPADVPVDNSARPEPSPADDDPPPPLQQELPAQRTRQSTHYGTFG
jgi:hypothetical protein